MFNRWIILFFFHRLWNVLKTIFIFIQKNRSQIDSFRIKFSRTIFPKTLRLFIEWNKSWLESFFMVSQNIFIWFICEIFRNYSREPCRIFRTEKNLRSYILYYRSSLQHFYGHCYFNIFLNLRITLAFTIQIFSTKNLQINIYFYIAFAWFESFICIKFKLCPYHAIYCWIFK